MRRIVDHTLRDVRFGIRMLLSQPLFTGVAVLVLALGIGANTAIFSMVNALLLRSIQYKESDRLVLLWNRSPGLGIAQDWLSPAEYVDINTQADVFDEAAVVIGGSFNLTGVDTPERIQGMRVSSSLFSLLRATPALGRVFTAEEDQPGRPQTVVLSNELWRTRFGSDPDIISKTLVLNERQYAVAGVMPPGFSLNKEVIPTVNGTDRADVILPLPLGAEALQNRGSENFNVVARLKAGTSISQAQASVDTIVDRLKRDYPRNYPANSGFTISVVPMLEQVVGDIRPALLLLLAAVGFVLLIACANVANLLLSRASTRQKEIAVRVALGAGRFRLIRQLLTESVLLALTGGGAGLLIAVWGIAGLRWLDPGNIPRLGEINVDARVFGFTFVLSLLTGLIFGITPALKASRLDLNEALKEGGRGMGPGGGGVRSVLIVSEVALSLVLLIGAALLIRSFMRVQGVDPGFSARNVLSLRLQLAGPKYRTEAPVVQFHRQLWERLSALPGVKSVGSISTLPLSPGVGWGSISVEGYQPPPGQDHIEADQRVVGQDYFQAMQIPLVNGRFFDDRDTDKSTKVAIVDETFARRFWPDGDPLGKRFKTGGPDSSDPWITIVGVVGDVRQYSLDAPPPRVAVYTADAQDPDSGMYLVLRTDGKTSGVADAAKEQIQAMDPSLPVFDVKMMDERISGSLARRRFSMLLLLLFAGVALVLATVGIYGVLSYSVAQRSHEIGIRMALGAGQQDVLRMVVRQGMKLALIGVGAGLGAALVLTRLMATLLFGVSATDPISFGSIPLLLAAVAFVAVYIPARRATRVDPMVSLRYE